MFNLVESVKEHGIITPATVRQKEDGRYELLSGHRRKRACELAGLETLRTEIVDMDLDSSIIFMVDSNLQRTTILPSEKGFSYKMRLEAMKRKAGRPSKENMSPVGTQLRSDAQLAQEVGDSRNQIHRYIRITELVPELIDLVDSGEVSLRPAVELSYLPDEEQYMVLEAIESEVCTPSHAQTIRMRRMFEEGKLTPEAIEAIMQEVKPNQKEKLVIRNTVSFKNLIKDHTYTVVGTIMDKESCEPLMINDQEITVEKEFRAESETGSVEMQFTFDGSALKGKEIVVFEDVYYEGKLIAVHADIEDKGQTVYFPEIKTSAVDSETGSNNSNADEMVTIIDTVSFKNLIKGETYKVSGILMDQETGQPLMIEGKEVTAEKEFVAETADGTVELSFTFNGSALAGKAVVVFEDMYYHDQLVAVHADITDKEQTIWLPEIKTTATDKADGDKEITACGKVTIVDKVAYEGIEVGQKFTVKGTLYDKETGKPLMIDGKEVTAETTFTAKEAEGSVEVEFTFDATELGDKELVVFEKLFHAESNVEIAKHEDIEDEGQTVKTVTPPPADVPQTGDNSNMIPWIALLGASAIALLSMAVVKRKKQTISEDETDVE